MDDHLDYLDLYTLQSALKVGIEDVFPEKIWVKAEISSVSVKGGHCYLELSQSEGGTMVAKARAVIWRSRYVLLSKVFEQQSGGPLRAGITVLVRVQVSYSELYAMTLVIDDIDVEVTLGERELQRRRTIERLEKDGLMDAQKALSLPDLPYALAVISAAGAAGYGDFCRHLHENEYGFVFRTDLFEASMQGAAAPESIAEALRSVQESGVKYDAVLILRGGGSSIDLDCYDDYGLAVAIATCPLPVFTAIGHERDHHVADMVACDFVKTPTALADEFIGRYVAEDMRIESYSSRLRLAFVNKINAILSRLDVLESRIKGADPRSVLSRGYVLTLDSKGRVLKSASALAGGDGVRVMFADGAADCVVEKVFHSSQEKEYNGRG